MKNTVLFVTGPSGSGKSYFAANMLPAGLFYKLKSATTRPMRAEEKDGREYYFRDESFFDTTPLVTRLWVNEQVWTPGKPKWMYGVPEWEVYNNPNRNFIYDVIEPKYARQMIDWFRMRNMAKNYNFRIAYFLPPENNMAIANKRANMPDDNAVRRANTCLPIDFLRAGLDIDYLIKSGPVETILNPRLMAHIRNLERGTK